ncbi:MAG: hypothetical protein RX316_04665 [bacterium]|nr:hypothetical protein [bacterium]
MTLAATIKPEDAISNLAAWAKYIGISKIPSWLATKTADMWAIVIGGILILISLFMLRTAIVNLLKIIWTPIKRIRLKFYLIPSVKDHAELEEARREEAREVIETVTGQKPKGITTSRGEPLGRIRAPTSFRTGEVNIFTVDKGKRELIEIRDALIKYAGEGDALLKEGKEQMTAHTLDEWTKETNDFKQRVTVYLRSKLGPPAAVILDDPTRKWQFITFNTDFGDEHNENLSSLSGVLSNLRGILMSLRVTVG